MKRLVVIGLAIAASAVAEPKLEPKIEPPPPPRVKEIAHRLFEEAAAAQGKGELDLAISKYHDLDRLAPHPNINFNLALVYEQKGDLLKAIEQYDKYLAVQTGDAKVAKHTADLRATPGKVELEATSKLGVKALWFLDGDLVARDSVKEIDLPSGRHRLDMVSELGYWGMRVDIDPGRSRTRDHHVHADPDVRADGNLILSTTGADMWGWFFAIDGSDRDDAIAKGVHHKGRYMVPVGKHAIQVKDSSCDYDATVTVGKDELVLVYFDRKGFDEKALLKERDRTRGSANCGTLIVKRTVVNFDAKIPVRK